MKYTLDNLGTNNFEHLVQSISKKIIGEGVSIYGAGPDGQREATFYGKSSYPSDQEIWDGYWIIQAKFKDPDTKKADFPWIKDCFEEEMKNFIKKKDEGKVIPDNYLFFTNIILTPVSEKGIKDKIDEVAKNYNYLIPHIHIIGADDIYRFLDGNRDIATTYASYIFSGDILSYLYEDIQKQNTERQKTFFRYLTQSFYDDYCSRMEQAGQVTEERVSIDKVYVDLNFIDEDTKKEEMFIEHALRIGNEFLRFSSIKSIKTSNTHNMDETQLSNKYVLKGSAGQGKSTVCQFLAQIYRVAFLKNFDDTVNPKIEDFIHTVQSDNIKLPTCYRIPIRIELRLYSSWIINRQKQEKSYDLITYISSIIADKASDKFDNETLRLYLEKYSWVFFFDGLDEVPESSNRKDIMNEIERFIEIELRQANTDALFFATTRPEGYVGEFDKAKFTHLDLLPLDRERCFTYLDKLLIAIEDDSTKRKNHLEILKHGWDNEQIAFMMQTPLQATIIAILVRAGGEPPRDKYSLFKEYFDIIIKREKQKGTGTILNTNQDLVEGVYYLLGYDLQKRSSTVERSDALISLDRMRELIKKKLHEDGIEKNDPNYSQLLNDTYLMIVNRINFASEIKEGYIGFSIRSMQEFLAAVYIVRSVDDRKLGALLKDLAKSAYWKNTFIFLVECIAKDKTYYLDYLIDTVLSELNGNDLPVGQISATASIYYGSQVAFTLLSNNIFKNKPKYENKLCKYITEYCNLEDCTDIHCVLSMSDNVKMELTKYILNKEKITDTDFILAFLLMHDERNKILLENFGIEHATKIVTQYYNLFNKTCPKNLYDIIRIAIQQGVIIEISIAQIVDIIESVEEFDNYEFKRNMLKITLKSLLGNIYHIENSDLLKINRFFNCDLKILYDLEKTFHGNEYKINDHLTIMYYVPSINKSKIDEILKCLSTYKLDGLSLIFKTIASKNIENYMVFFENIGNYLDEIKELNAISLIGKNILTWTLYRKAVYNDDYKLDLLLNEHIANSLKSPMQINTLNDFLYEQKNGFSLYSMAFHGCDECYLEFYSEIKKLLSVDEIKQIPNIRNTLIFLYCFKYCNMQDKSKDKFSEWDKYLNEMFEYTKIKSHPSLWDINLWCISFLKMQPKDYNSNSNIIFRKSKNSERIGIIPFSTEENSKILSNIINYTLVTGNTSTFNFMYDFILSNCNYDILLNVDWDSLNDFKENNIFCISKILNAKNEQDVIEICCADDTFAIDEFIIKFILNIDLPGYYLPLYIHCLNKSRKEGNKCYVKDLEEKIKYYITSCSIDI